MARVFELDAGAARCKAVTLSVRRSDIGVSECLLAAFPNKLHTYIHEHDSQRITVFRTPYRLRSRHGSHAFLARILRCRFAGGAVESSMAALSLLSSMRRPL